MKRCLALLVVLAASVPAAAEQIWEVRGDLVAVESGTSAVAVLRLPDGRQLRVPLDSLSEASRAAARRVGAKQAADAASASASPEPRDGAGAGPGDHTKATNRTARHAPRLMAENGVGGLNKETR